MKTERVLLMASYCEDCTDDLPCLDCLKMSNVIEIPFNRSGEVKVIGGWDYLTEQKTRPMCAKYATCGSTDMYPCSTCGKYEAPEEDDRAIFNMFAAYPTI